MNEIIKAMEERRSIRKFQPTMPTKDDLAQIVEAGLYAASGMGRQSAIIVAVRTRNCATSWRKRMRKSWASRISTPSMAHRRF